MHSRITQKLIVLEAQGEINRKQLSKWLGKSLSYVDQRFQDTKDWVGEDVDVFILKAFELKIHDLLELWVPQDMSMIDWEGIEMFLNGCPDDEICEILQVTSRVRRGKLEKGDKDKLHSLVEQLIKEVE